MYLLRTFTPIPSPPSGYVFLTKSPALGSVLLVLPLADLTTLGNFFVAQLPVENSLPTTT